MRKPRVSAEVPEIEPELPVALLDIDGVGQRLGVGRDKVFHLMKHEGLPYIQWGARTIKFHPAAVARWLQQQSQSSAS